MEILEEKDFLKKKLNFWIFLKSLKKNYIIKKEYLETVADLMFEISF